MKTIKEVEKEILQLTEDFNNKKIDRKFYVEKQIELMEYSLKNFKLSFVKQTYIKNVLKMLKIARGFL